MKMAAGIFHTIVFHRALGLMRPKEIDMELFDITYVQCGDAAVERKIDEKIPQFIDRVKKHPSRKHQAHDLSLYPSMRSKTSRPHGSQTKFNVTTGNTEVITESSPKERDALHLGLELSLREVLFQIINFGSEKKGHIPPLSNLEGAPFPFQITISSTLPRYNFSSFGMEVLKRMLQAGRPTML
ncbi:hypothetical protein P3S67_025076 [Capsicum chacoense]